MSVIVVVVVVVVCLFCSSYCAGYSSVCDVFHPMYRYCLHGTQIQRVTKKVKMGHSHTYTTQKATIRELVVTILFEEDPPCLR